MLQKMDLSQLQMRSLEEVVAFKESAIIRKSELEAAKTKGGKAWTPEMQDELNEIAIFLVDIEDCIDEKTAEAAKIEALQAIRVEQAKSRAEQASKETETSPKGYVVKQGTEDMVHLKLVKGKRYNPNTGDEISKPYVQVFTFSEWQLFKKNFTGLGYVIVDVLHDNYNEAKQYVTTKKK